LVFRFDAEAPRPLEGVRFGVPPVRDFWPRIICAVQKPRVAPAQLLAALNHKLSHGFFMVFTSPQQNERFSDRAVPSRAHEGPPARPVF